MPSISQDNIQPGLYLVAWCIQGTKIKLARSLIVHQCNWKPKCKIKFLIRYFMSFPLDRPNLINIFIDSQSSNRQHHSQTIHSKEKLILMNLFKIVCVVTWAWLFLTSMVIEAEQLTTTPPHKNRLSDCHRILMSDDPSPQKRGTFLNG